MTELHSRSPRDDERPAGARISQVDVRGSLVSDDGRGEFELDAVIIVGREGGATPRSRLEIRGPGLELVARDFAWLVTTTRGWIHTRGHGSLNGSPAPVPFRVDLYSAAADRSDGAGSGDRASVRVYEAGADPNLTSPSLKVSGQLAAGSVRATSDAKTAQGS